MKLHNFVICLLFGVILADDALEDVQTEFYLPYSATEDVDFSLSKPSGFGCYQWLVWLLKALQYYSIIQFRHNLDNYCPSNENSYFYLFWTWEIIMLDTFDIIFWFIFRCML